MKERVIPCFYNQANPIIKDLGDLKIEYASNQNFLIKSMLRQAEDLIVFRVGTKEMLINRMKSVVNPTLEERCFFEKIKRLLK